MTRITRIAMGQRVIGFRAGGSSADDAHGKLSNVTLRVRLKALCRRHRFITLAVAFVGLMIAYLVRILYITGGSWSDARAPFLIAVGVEVGIFAGAFVIDAASRGRRERQEREKPPPGFS